MSFLPVRNVSPGSHGDHRNPLTTMASNGVCLATCAETQIFFGLAEAPTCIGAFLGTPHTDTGNIGFLHLPFCMGASMRVNIKSIMMKQACFSSAKHINFCLFHQSCCCLLPGVSDSMLQTTTKPA